MSRSPSLSYNRNILQDKKGTIAYLVLFDLAVIALGLVFFLGDRLVDPAVATLLQWLAFLCLGLGHLFLLQRRFALFQKEVPLFGRAGWSFTASLGLQLLVLLYLLYFFTLGSFPTIPFISLCAFLLPFTVANAWSVFSQIPHRQYKIWFDYAEDNRLHMPLMKGMPVRLRLRRRYFDIREELFTVTVPVRITLGKLFHYFLLEQEKSGPSIERSDEDKRPYGWEFYYKDFGGMTKKFLDTEKTLAENKIRKNHIIIARRVRAMRPLLKN